MNRGRWFHALTFMASVALITGCGGFHQDPLKGQVEAVPPVKDVLPPAAKPIRADALKIDTARDVFDFREDEEGEIDIKGRVLLPKTDFKIAVENLADFKDAKVEPLDVKNPGAGVRVTWKPAIGFSGADPQSSTVLNVVLTTLTTPRMSVHKALRIVVTRKNNVPEVVSFDNLSQTPIREGEVRKFKVVVRDLDGIDVDGSRPELLAVADRHDKSDISHLVTQDYRFGGSNPKRDASDPSLWSFDLTLDLRGRDLTAGEEGFGFGLRATSRFGAPSANKHVDVRIRTLVRNPTTSWTDPVTVIAGEDSVFNFFVYDTKASGKISVNFTDRPDIVLGQASWDCPPVRDVKTPTVCTIRWKVPENPAKTEFQVPMELRNQSPVNGDQEEKKVRVIGRFIVKKPDSSRIPPKTARPELLSTRKSFQTSEGK